MICEPGERLSNAYSIGHLNNYQRFDEHPPLSDTRPVSMISQFNHSNGDTQTFPAYALFAGQLLIIIVREGCIGSGRCRDPILPQP